MDELLEKVAVHLRQMAPHVRERRTAKLLQQLLDGYVHIRMDDLNGMGDSPCWPRSHDSNCEGKVLDITDGIMLSACGCEVRWYQRALRSMRAELEESRQKR